MGTQSSSSLLGGPVSTARYTARSVLQNDWCHSLTSAPQTTNTSCLIWPVVIMLSPHWNVWRSTSLLYPRRTNQQQCTSVELSWIFGALKAKVYSGGWEASTDRQLRQRAHQKMCAGIRLDNTQKEHHAKFRSHNLNFLPGSSVAWQGKTKQWTQFRQYL